MPRITVTTGFLAATRAIASCMRLAAAHAAAGAVDLDQQRLHAVVAREPRNCLRHLAVFGDDPRDGQPRNVGALHHARAAKREADARQHRQHGRGAPIEQAALEAPPVQQKVGFQAHVPSPRRKPGPMPHARVIERVSWMPASAGMTDADRATAVLRITAPSAPAGCGDGSRPPGCRRARRRCRRCRTRRSRSCPPRLPCP